MSQDVDVIIIGAGAAGLSAAKEAARQGLTFTLLEASHRIGGRAYTEYLTPDIPYDLGCHWMHSASINPFVTIADTLGHPYVKAGTWRNKIWWKGKWSTEAERDELLDYFDRSAEAVIAAAKAGRDVPVSDVIDLESPYCPMYAYFHSLDTSGDLDQVSVFDTLNYNDTDENWPLRNGYGTLINDWAKEVPVTLNCKAETVHWGGKDIRVDTSKGTVTGKRVVITVSTNILSAGQIAFDPPLPDWKLDAAHNLPLGVHNRIAIVLKDNPFGDEPVDENENTSVMVTLEADDDVPISLKVRPFGFDYVAGVTGGRHGEWLSKAGQQASVDHVTERLVAVYGSDIRKSLSDRTIVTAWETDPWVLGAYSGALAGHGGDRAILRKPIDNRLYFAGEATSDHSFATAHGAMMSGIDVIDSITGNQPSW